ncbi:hypothetical protein NPIL_352691 [Nephila pilipes]|uniref:Uncharacterized protein n=1 Tax=Nephila pilipes TaxID=299642 RepID=A0A8X6MLP3_NEPPI|nr:hypothetical protein NPIL_352691 [Nephila pilipes]
MFPHSISMAQRQHTMNVQDGSNQSSRLLSGTPETPFVSFWNAVSRSSSESKLDLIYLMPDNRRDQTLFQFFLICQFSQQQLMTVIFRLLLQDGWTIFLFLLGAGFS